MIVGQTKIYNSIDNIFKVFIQSDAALRPHFILAGPTGSGKSEIIGTLAKLHKINFLEINAAQLTKEGTSGNSVSKALSPLINMPNKSVVFVDEFDKLFLSTNSNDSCAHESTTGVQNEFLKILEHSTASVFGDYGKYINVPIANKLFVFAGAFNGEPNLNIKRLQEIGLKTEFIGRVPLVYNTEKLSLDDLKIIMKNSDLLDQYCKFFNRNINDVLSILYPYLEEQYDLNTIGARLCHLLIHQYFIDKISI